jgi:LysR family transcriptional regulator, low CO2-responsive transcriptional regulator
MLKHEIRRYFQHGTLTQLNTFEAVARLGSFTRAGEELCLAQPTVSVHIKKLTDIIGVPLLKQSGKQIQLTEAGNQLLTECAEILHALARFENKVAHLRSAGVKENQLAVTSSSSLR